jgi:hypothetical protein
MLMGDDLPAVLSSFQIVSLTSSVGQSHKMQLTLSNPDGSTRDIDAELDSDVARDLGRVLALLYRADE